MRRSRCGSSGRFAEYEGHFLSTLLHLLALAQVSGAILGEVQGFESSKSAKDVASINTATVTGRKVRVAAVKKRGWYGENRYKRLDLILERRILSAVEHAILRATTILIPATPFRKFKGRQAQKAFDCLPWNNEFCKNSLPID